MTAKKKKTAPEPAPPQREPLPPECRQHHYYEARCSFCVAYAAALGIDPPAYACGGYDEDDDQPRDFGDL